MIVQGTALKVIVTVTNDETGLLDDPDDFWCTVLRPDGSVVQMTFSAGQVERLGVGKYQAVIDTTPQSGYYQYEAAAIGGEGVRVQRAFRVKPAIGPTS